MTTEAGDRDPAAAARARSAVRVSIAALAFCLAAFALTFTFGSVAGEELAGMGSAALFPRLVLGAMVVLAILMAFGIGAPPMELPPPIHRMSVMVGLGMIAFMGAIALVGMWASCVIFLVIVGRMWGERSWVRLTVSAVLICGALYALFVTFLQGVFPAGMIGALLH